MKITKEAEVRRLEVLSLCARGPAHPCPVCVQNSLAHKYAVLARHYVHREATATNRWRSHWARLACHAAQRVRYHRLASSLGLGGGRECALWSPGVIAVLEVRGV